MTSLVKQSFRLPSLAHRALSRRLRTAFVTPSGNFEKDASQYWNESSTDTRKQDLSHWRGIGRYADESRWRIIGENHFKMYQDLCRLAGVNPSVRTMLEWGPGGGSNAVRFSEVVENYYGVDISKPNLEECQKQCDAHGFPGFRPVLIDCEQPQECLKLVKQPLDFFLSTAVFQHFPSKDYGVTVTKLVHQMLADNGLAIIQTRYDNGTKKFQSKDTDYQSNAVTFTSYRIDEYWKHCQEIGFEVLNVKLDPQVNYAFYFMRKKAA